MGDSELVRKGRQAAAFLPILQSPYRDEIDDRLFKQNENVKSVHTWLSTVVGDTSISYIMLWRYHKRIKKNAVEGVITDSAQQTMERNWDVLTMFVRKFEDILEMQEDAGERGARLDWKVSDVLKAIQIQNSLIKEYGGVPGTQQVMEDAQLRFTKLIDIVLEVVNEEQKAYIAQRISETPDLMEWAAPESTH